MTRGKFDPMAKLSAYVGTEKAAQLQSQFLQEQEGPPAPTVASATARKLRESTQKFGNTLISRDQVLTEPPEPRLSVKAWIDRMLSCPEYLDLHLKPSEDKTYRGMLELAIHNAKARGLHRKTTTVTFHIPAEFLFRFCGISSSSFYNAVKTLQRHRLVATRGKTATLYGQGRKSGTLCCVKLNPRHTHITPRLTIEDLRFEWRDLQEDVKAGKTAYKTLNGESYKSEEVLSTQYLISNWTLPPSSTNQDTLSMTLQSGSEAVWDVFDLPTLREARKSERSALVFLMADGIASKLRDMQSVNFYRWALWQCLRLLDQGIDQFGYLQSSIQRMEIAQREDAVRKSAGARLVDEWKRTGFLQELRDVPRYRVGKVVAA